MHSARRILELRCDKHSEEPNADSKLSDRCLTDPEPGMEPRQAQFRNLHSKCRCSCVLQFTRHHRVSSVLHRPPSRMIHCIVLWFGFSDKSQSTSGNAGQANTATCPNRGRSKLESRRELFEPLAIPSWTSYSASPCRRGTVPQQRAVTVETADILSTIPLATLQVLKDSPGPLEQLPRANVPGFMQFI